MSWHKPNKERRIEGHKGEEIMSTASKGSGTSVSHKSHSYLAAFILGGALLPAPIVATILTATIYISQFPPSLLSLLSPWITLNWLAITAGLAITLVLWLLSALFFKNFVSMDSANPVSAGHLRSHLSALRAGFNALHELDDNGKSLPKERLYSYRIAWAQVKAYLEEIDSLFERKDTRWVAGTGYLHAWLLIHRAEEVMLTLAPGTEVIREALHDEMSLTGSSMPARASALRKLEQAVKDISASARQYLDFTENRDLQNVATTSKGQNSTTLSDTLSVVANTPGSSTAGETAKTTDEKNPAPDETPTVTAQGPEVAIPNGMPKGANETPSNAPVSATSTVTVQTPGSVVTSESPAEHIIAEMEARNVLRDVRRTIDEYRDSLWEGLVTGRNILIGTAIITSLLTYVLLCFAIITNASPASISAAIAFYLVGAGVGLFGRLYDESKVENVAQDYNLTLARIIVTPLLAGIAGVVGVLLTGLLSVTLLKSALPQTPGPAAPQLTLLDNFDIQRNTLGLLIAAAFALTPNLLINTLKKKASDFTDQLRSTSASQRTTSTDQSTSGNKP